MTDIVDRARQARADWDAAAPDDWDAHNRIASLIPDLVAEIERLRDELKGGTDE